MANQNKFNNFPAWGLGRKIYSEMASQAAIDLKVFDIIASSGRKAQLSSDEILSKLPKENPIASHTLERILRMLGVHSILTMSSRQCQNDNNKTETTYGWTKELGFSASPRVKFYSEKGNIDCLSMLKGSALNHGRSFFQDASGKRELNQMFIEMLTFIVRCAAEGILESYKGFDSVTELMDVGGCTGRTIEMIVSRYPHIHGINFDLPHIIANASELPGVKHSSGDMLQSIPKAQTIFLKLVLHYKNDDQCKKILRNCWLALPDNGKVISVEFIMPRILDNNTESSNVVTSDFMMLVHLEGKERSQAEFEVWAKTAGFKEIKVFPIGNGFHVMEFIKSTAK